MFAFSLKRSVALEHWLGDGLVVVTRLLPVPPLRVQPSPCLVLLHSFARRARLEAGSTDIELR